MWYPGDLYLIRFYLRDLFLVVQNVGFTSYADDNTVYDAGVNTDEVIFSLPGSSKRLFKWFADNQMKTNEDKCHLIISTNELPEIQIGDFSIKTRNAMRCNNRDDSLHLSFTLKISIFSEAYI